LRVVFSDMDQVLGSEAGNALEVRTVLDILCGRGGDARLRELTLVQAGELLCMGGLASNAAEADARLRAVLASGAAAERFARMVAQLGGPADLLERADDYLPRAPIQRAVPAPAAGFVSAMDVRALGDAIVGLGGGRRVASGTIDHAVGLSVPVDLGQRVERGDTLALVHARDESDADAAVRAVLGAIAIGDAAPAGLPLYQWYRPS